MIHRAHRHSASGGGAVIVARSDARDNRQRPRGDAGHKGDMRSQRVVPCPCSCEAQTREGHLIGCRDILGVERGGRGTRQLHRVTRIRLAVGGGTAARRDRLLKRRAARNRRSYRSVVHLRRAVQARNDQRLGRDVGRQTRLGQRVVAGLISAQRVARGCDRNARPHVGTRKGVRRRAAQGHRVARNHTQ